MSFPSAVPRQRNRAWTKIVALFGALALLFGAIAAPAGAGTQFINKAAYDVAKTWTLKDKITANIGNPVTSDSKPLYQNVRSGGGCSITNVASPMVGNGQISVKPVNATKDSPSIGKIGGVAYLSGLKKGYYHFQFVSREYNPETKLLEGTCFQDGGAGFRVATDGATVRVGVAAKYYTGAYAVQGVITRDDQPAELGILSTKWAIVFVDGVVPNS